MDDTKTQRGRLIAVSGRMGTGKSTVAIHLKNQGFVEISFAEALKRVVAVVFDWPYEILLADTPERRALRGKLPTRRFNGVDYDARHALQFIGTDLFREYFDPEVWVAIVRMKVRSLLDQGKDVIISDARFKNEMDLIKELGGKCLILARTENDLRYDPKGHPSENEFLTCLDDVEVLYNTSSIPDLYKNVDMWINKK